MHTDHMNIVCGNLSNDRITRWRLLLEECGPAFVHVKGTDNTVADALSHLDMTGKEDFFSSTRSASNGSHSGKTYNNNKGHSLAQVINTTYLGFCRTQETLWTWHTLMHQMSSKN